MRRLKSAPDPWLELPVRVNRQARDESRHWLDAPRVIGGVEFLFSTAWMVLTLPLRLVFGVFGLIGRLAALVVGFSIMVFGAALLPGPFVLIGVPLFVIGLLLALRSLG